MNPSWQFSEKLGLVFKSDNGCVYELAAEWAPTFIHERDKVLARALLQHALAQLEALP